MPEGKAQRAKRNSARQKAQDEPAYAFIPESRKKQLLRDLTRKSFGEDASVDAFVMLLQLIRDAMPERPAKEYLEASDLLFDAQRYAFNNSRHHLVAFMDYREFVKRQLADYLRDPSNG